MKRWKTILLALLGLLVVSQLPFAYRRYRLGRLDNAIQALARERTVPLEETGLVDYRGVIHVHTSLGGHSTGNFSELIPAAKANGLDFVIMTEHPQPDFDTSAMTLNGIHGGMLFVNGNEVVTANGDRLLLIPGDESANGADQQPTEVILAKQKAKGGLAIVAYPTASEGWRAKDVNGVEVYNLFTNASRLNRAVTFFDYLWSGHSYPGLMFLNFFVRPSDNLKRWDDAIAAGKRRLTATAGNDAHSNIGLSVNDATGKQLLGLKLDPYERSFRLVRTHVLIESGKPLTRDSLLEAIARGHCYVSFDLFGDAAGFSFTARNDSERKMMGDEVAFSDRLRLRAQAPLACRFLLFRDGEQVDQKSGERMAEFAAPERGAYRIEAYLDALPFPARDQPWIISNPIYVR